MIQRELPWGVHFLGHMIGQRHNQTRLADGRWVRAVPLPYSGSRLIAAWWVLTGRAYAIVWPQAGELEAVLDPQVSFQIRVHDWVLNCFGRKLADNKKERHIRFLEEALELVQAGSCSIAEVTALVEYVFHRPVGEVSKEVGGVITTLAALCAAYDIDLNKEAECELDRIWVNIKKIREKQKNKPYFTNNTLPTQL